MPERSYQTAVSPADRSGIVAAVSISLAIHVAGAIWFALKPPMFTRTRTDAPIRVELVPAPRPIPPPPLPAGGGGGGGAAPQQLVRERAPDKAPRPARRAAAPPRPAPEPQLPQAAEVEPGPATAPETSERTLEAATASAGELGIGSGSGSGTGSGPGSGGGSGGGRGGGVGTGTGSGSGPGQGSVEVKPRELRRPSFAEMRQLYPEDARREGIQARVRLQLLVDTSGRVADVRVVRPAGHGFDEAAAALARRFLFEPGTRDGRPVPMWITLTYSFEIEG